MNILVSACLLGMNCRYNATGNLEPAMEELKNEHILIPVCPEIYGGLSTPRNPAERVGDKIRTKCNEDVTAEYEKGACEIAKLALFYKCKFAILKERSPSCGSGMIYDGTFSNTLIPGDGLTVEKLKQQGVTVIGESKIEEFQRNGILS